MGPRSIEDSSQTSPKAKHEGIVVWDQKGLVVLWPDGHCSRFSWDALRQACLCPTCHAQHAAREMHWKNLLSNQHEHRLCSCHNDR